MLGVWPIIKSMGIWQLGKKDVVIGRGSCARHGLGEFFLFFFVMTDSLCLHSSIVSFTLILLFVPAIFPLLSFIHFSRVVFEGF